MELTAQVVQSLPKPHHIDVLAGAEHFEDAGVFRINESTAIVQTLDFFPPLVDDAYTFGQIAAANSLSDVYAMGGTPITALNIVAFVDKELPADLLLEILRGGQERVSAAGAVILGGHSVRDSEIKYGLSVTGVVHPDRFVTNSGAKAGDVLVLTKPIGSGVLTSAAKKGTIPESDLDEAISVMTALNKEAAEAMMTIGVHAATDITGFGLLGHAFEMAEGAQLTIKMSAADVPLMSQVKDLAGQGILTRAHQATRKHLGDRLQIDAVDEVIVNVLADAQTSGGLLISVAPEKADRLVDTIRENGGQTATIIGEVTDRGQHAIVLR